MGAGLGRAVGRVEGGQMGRHPTWHGAAWGQVACLALGQWKEHTGGSLMGQEGNTLPQTCLVASFLPRSSLLREKCVFFHLRHTTW